MTPTLKIALLTYSTKPRGSVIHTLELANALSALGHQVCVYALDKDSSGFDWDLACECCLIAARPAADAIDLLIHQRIQEFMEALQSGRRYDLYHAQDCIGANALIQLRQAQSGFGPIVRTVHHIEGFSSPYLQQCQEKSIRLPDLCLCVSDRWQQVLAQDYGIHAPKVLNGIDLRRFSPQPSGQEALIRQRYGITTRPTFLTVGGIEPRKNSVALLQAFAQVRQQLPTAQLIVAGGATLFDYQPYRQQFFQLAEQLSIVLGESLLLPGVIPQADLPALYRSADVFVFPSTREGWGLVVLEAIACGLPVITSNQGPFTEFLSPHQAALVNPKDAGAIAKAMLRLVNPYVADFLVSSSQRILRQYTWQRSAQMHLDAYAKIMTLPAQFQT
ncbi:MAG: MSMEG_0565 family glycosyltransferase [Leptolyngbyaceae cyanobacterium SM1_1_3]|nr:MSMEG_0565 family glycosyltransferase [Leptolyngbyaceae cyanobacterium SM1_1_3]NJN03563.1 MSMEG_0565 family glycosyltransferase [Leptolyngbyaceae cyanobacterium RM1_1_2]NJO11389.1 MSMEG_0565 family glycosyltransferase [Leptolyngbyaceae cyanobacterium SL_1_1]